VSYFLSYSEKHLPPSMLAVNQSPKRVYLAGPIDYQGWRGEIVPCHSELDFRKPRDMQMGVFDLPTITRGVVCVGPLYYVCGHSASRDREGRRLREDVFHDNLSRVERADAVFAYFDSAKDRASDFELGYAHALRKPIFVGFSPHAAALQAEMWFAAQAGIGSGINHVGSVQELWALFCLTLGRHGAQPSMGFAQTTGEGA